MSVVKIYGVPVVDTELSVLIDFGGKEAIWVPKFVICEEDGTPSHGRDFIDDEGESFYIKESWASQEGLV